MTMPSHLRHALARLPAAWAALGGLPAPALAQGAPAPGAGDLLQVLLGLVGVLAFILVAAWLLRRLSALGGPAGGALRVVGGISLGARERVVLVQVGERQVLLGVAPGRVTTLHVLERPLEVGGAGAAGSEAGQGGFARVLGRVLAGTRDAPKDAMGGRP